MFPDGSAMKSVALLVDWPDPDVALREWHKVSLAAAHEQHRAAATSLGFPWTTHAELHNF
jgi:hypothetical protein